MLSIKSDETMEDSYGENGTEKGDLLGRGH
jgi:hypothetical protein